MTDTIGSRLKSVRMEHDISISQLARDMEVERRTIYRAENDLGMPSTFVIMKYSEYFCISADWILFGKEYEE